MKAESMWTCFGAILLTSGVAMGLVRLTASPPQIPIPTVFDVTHIVVPTNNASGYKSNIVIKWKWAEDWPKYRGYHRVEFAIEARSDATHWNWTQIGRVMSNSFTINNRLPQEQFRVKTMTNSLPWIYTK
jgi:uncharacterized protein YcsI (UPF0317 family)